MYTSTLVRSALPVTLGATLRAATHQHRPPSMAASTMAAPASAHCEPVNAHWPERTYSRANMSKPCPAAAHTAANTDMTARAASSAMPA